VQYLMTDFLCRLPAPRRNAGSSDISSIDAGGSFRFGDSGESTSTLATNQQVGNRLKIPPYGQRSDWVPRTAADFGDGGAYPEVHLAQFPSDLGRKSNTSGKNVPLQTGPDGKIQFDAILRQNNDKMVIHSRPGDQIPVWSDQDLLSKPKEDDESENLEKTKQSFELELSKNMNQGIVKKPTAQDPRYIKYTPAQQAPGHNANCSQRIVRLVEKQTDPIEPPKFRHKKIPTGPPSPPPPIQHSPPRKLTAKDQQEWKIPPSVSNWKNQKGYTIPLDKRLQADGRGLQDITINDKFAALSESLYVAERAAREEIRVRNEMVKQKKAKEEEIRELQLRELAVRARAERSNLIALNRHDSEEDAARLRRQQVEVDRKRELERDFRLEKAGKKGKRNRDADRDVSERIALGQAQPTSQESLFDARLFNQTSGMDTGYNAGHDESYAVYDQPLFADRSAAGIYRFEKDRMQHSVGEADQLPTFSGAEKDRQRTAPVQFEKDAADPFGLDTLLSEAKKK